MCVCVCVSKEKSSTFPEENCVFDFYAETSTKINWILMFLYRRRYVCVCVCDMRETENSI